MSGHYNPPREAQTMADTIIEYGAIVRHKPRKRLLKVIYKSRLSDAEIKQIRADSERRRAIYEH